MGARSSLAQVNVRRILSLAHQPGDIDLRRAFEVPERQWKTVHAPGAHFGDAQFLTQHRGAYAGLLLQRLHQVRSHGGASFVAVEANLDPAILPRQRPQNAALHSMSPRAMASSSSQSAARSGVAGPLAKPSSTSARGRCRRCSRRSLRIRSRTYSLVLSSRPTRHAAPHRRAALRARGCSSCSWCSSGNHGQPGICCQRDGMSKI